MNKLLLIGLLAGAALITGVAYYASEGLEATSSLTGPRPENFRKCEDKKYTLEFDHMDIDHDLIPGQPTKMTSTFKPQADGRFEKMQIRVYLKGIKVWSTEHKKPAEFKAGEDWIYNYTITLPGVVPHVKVTLKMWMLGGADGKQELSCEAFDVQM